MGKSCIKSPVIRRAQTGASMLEATIAIPVFLLLFFIIIDLARYFFVYLVFTYAAHHAADLGAKLEVEQGITESDCILDDHRCNFYVRRVERILNDAVGIARLVASDSATPSGVRLTNFRHYDTSIYSSSPNNSGLPGCVTRGVCSASSITSDAAFFRPGERVLRLSGVVGPVDHPTRGFGTGPAQGWPNAVETWPTLLDQQPIMVLLEASFRPVTPGFGPIPVRASAFAFRRSRQYGIASPPIMTTTTVTTTTTLTTTSTTVTTTSSTSTTTTSTTTTSTTTTSTSTTSTSTTSTSTTSSTTTTTYHGPSTTTTTTTVTTTTSTTSTSTTSTSTTSTSTTTTSTSTTSTSTSTTTTTSTSLTTTSTVFDCAICQAHGICISHYQCTQPEDDGYCGINCDLLPH
ncbi:MAG: pilus assembly protein [Deltaproteobacteria bacterium]|nr:pilus assembly protein [Deltaproteobacteria bacterium]